MINRFFFLLLFIVSSLGAKSKYEELIKIGREYALNFDFKQAENSFYEAINSNPANPAGYYHISQIHLWFYLGSRNHDELYTFQEFSDKALNAIENIDDDNFTPQLFQLKGQILTTRAIAEGIQGEMMSAFWSSNSAVGAFEDAVDMDEAYTDPYVGMGIFSYALSFVPGIAKFAIGISGLSSDKTLGLKYLKKGYDGGGEEVYEAAFHLTKIYAEYIAEYDSARITGEFLVNAYPNNELFRYQYALGLIISGNYDEAIIELDKVIEISHPNFQMTTSLAYFLKGDIHFRKNDFEKAIEYYSKFIDNAVAIDFTGIANYRTAISHLMQGNEHQAQRYIFLSYMGNHELAEDEFASRKSKILLQEWNEVEKQLILSENGLFSGDYQKVIERLNHTGIDIDDKKQNARSDAFLSFAHLMQGNYKNAVISGNNSLETESDGETWTKSLAAISVALAYYNQNNSVKASEFLDIAEDEIIDNNKVFIESRINWLKLRLGILD